MSSEAATIPSLPAVPTPPPIAFPVNDFGDRLSPMLVKELRQGLRARTFVGLFVAVHTLLCFIFLVSISASDRSNELGPFISKAILGFLSVALLVIQPLRAIGAIHSEIRSNTIEMMVLTRLGAWRIVLGKWFSLTAQSILIASSIVPYLILRYFLGSMNLFAELHAILWILIASALFITVPLGLSATPNILIRGLLPLVGATMVCAGIIDTLDSNYSYNEIIEIMTFQEKEAVVVLLTFFFIAVYLAWNLLNLVTRQIAPISQNLSTVHRLVAIALILTVPWIILSIDPIGHERGMIAIAVGLFIAIPACFLALAEPLHLIPTFSRAFTRFKLLGTLFKPLLYPGWPSATLFTFLLILLQIPIVQAGLSIYTSGSTYYSSDPALMGKHTMETISVSLIGFNVVLLSSIGSYPFRRKVKSLFTMMILVMVFTALVAMITAMISDEMHRDSLLWIACWTPLGIISFLENSEAGVAMVLSITQTVMYSFLLGWLAFRTYRQARRETLVDPSSIIQQA